MTIIGRNSHDRNDAVCLGRAIAAELRRMDPVGTQKALERRLSCGRKLAESILDGHLSAPTLGKLIAAFGAPWLAERVLEAAGLNLEILIETKAAEAEAAADRAREAAREARALHERFTTAQRGDLGVGGGHP